MEHGKLDRVKEREGGSLAERQKWESVSGKKDESYWIEVLIQKKTLFKIDFSFFPKQSLVFGHFLFLHKRILLTLKKAKIKINRYIRRPHQDKTFRRIICSKDEQITSPCSILQECNQ